MGENKAPNLSTHRLVYRELDLVFNETIKQAHNAPKFNQPYHFFIADQTIVAIHTPCIAGGWQFG
jgi:hypothetical protein